MKVEVLRRDELKLGNLFWAHDDTSLQCNVNVCSCYFADLYIKDRTLECFLIMILIH
jgi:hypothetical protein